MGVGVGGQQGTGRLHVTPDRVSTVVSQEGHRTAVHGPPLGQTRVRRPCSPRGAEEAAQVPAPPRKTRPHRTARRVPSGRPRAQLPPCAAGAPGAHGEDSGHAHTQPLFHALEGNVCGGKVMFRVHGLHPLSERASGRRIRRRRPRAGPSGRPPGSAPCSRPAAPAAPQVPGDQAAPPGGPPTSFRAGSARGSATPAAESSPNRVLLHGLSCLRRDENASSPRALYLWAASPATF